MGNSDNNSAGIIAMVGGVIEATIIIWTITDFDPFLDRSAFGFLFLPCAAVITGIYMVRFPAQTLTDFAFLSEPFGCSSGAISRHFSIF